jgi:hypothetical protein
MCSNMTFFSAVGDSYSQSHYGHCASASPTWTSAAPAEYGLARSQVRRITPVTVAASQGESGSAIASHSSSIHC